MSVPEILVIRPAATDEQRETMDAVIGMVAQVVKDGSGVCKLCRERFFGDFDDVLQQLGEHGETVHRE